MGEIVFPVAANEFTPEFLTRVIDLYARQPERRAAIGTVEELERLRDTLTRQVT